MKKIFDSIRNNKLLTFILAISTINLSFSLSLEGKISKSYEETVKMIEVTEKKYLESARNETITTRNIKTSTEYVISNQNKEAMITKLINTISKYESTINSYEQAYIDIEKALLSAHSEPEITRLKNSLERIIKNRDEFIKNNIDQYSIAYNDLKKIFNTDIKNKSNL